MVRSAFALGLGVGLLLSCFGCSLLAERQPPSAGEHVVRSEKRCDPQNLWFPVYDTMSVGAGVTWVLYANQHIDSIDAQPDRSHDDASIYKYERAGGFAIIALYGASAIYGYFTEAQCSAWRKRRARGGGEALPTSERASFPRSVYGFSFDMPEAKAARQCASAGQEWHLEGGTGLCQSPVESVAKPDLRLEFRLGVPWQISVIYHSRSDGLNKNYDELERSLRGTYGPPQVAATRMSAACATSLADCLRDNERPVGPVWHWASGSIELAPLWSEDHAVLELHYTSEEAQAQ